MNREQLVVKVIASLTHASWPDGRHDGFPTTVVAKMLAPGVLDAILPQLTTVAEIEQLTVGSLLMGDNGYVLQLKPIYLNRSTGWREYLTEELREHGPLTVVWTPEAVTS